MFRAPVAERWEGEIKSLGGKCSDVLELCLAAVTREAVILPACVTQGGQGSCEKPEAGRNIGGPNQSCARRLSLGRHLWWSPLPMSCRQRFLSPAASALISFFFPHYFFSLKLSVCLRDRLKDGKTKGSSSLGACGPWPEPPVCEDRTSK